MLHYTNEQQFYVQVRTKYPSLPDVQLQQGIQMIQDTTPDSDDNEFTTLFSEYLIVMHYSRYMVSGLDFSGSPTQTYAKPEVSVWITVKLCSLRGTRV